MAVDKLVDSSKLNAALDYEASKIIAKGGGTAPLAFDFANEKGFGDYIDAIPSGGGSSEKLLASGTYTVAAVNSSVNIPVTVSVDESKITKILVIKDAQTSGVGQMLSFAAIYPRVPQSLVDEIGPNFPKGYYVASNGTSHGYCNYQSGSTTNVICQLNVANQQITIRQYSNNFRIQPDTYHWYIWGEEATS